GPAATLAVRPIGADGVPGKPTVISQKALSIGGGAPAPAPPPGAPPPKKPQNAGPWGAPGEGGAPGVGPQGGAEGRERAPKSVTVIARKQAKTAAPPPKGAKGGKVIAPSAPPSEASDVAIADTGDGYVVAWVDTRDGNAEIYAAKLDRSLTKVIPDRRITEAP